MVRSIYFLIHIWLGHNINTPINIINKNNLAKQRRIDQVKYVFKIMIVIFNIKFKKIKHGKCP